MWYYIIFIITNYNGLLKEFLVFKCFIVILQNMMSQHLMNLKHIKKLKTVLRLNSTPSLSKCTDRDNHVLIPQCAAAALPVTVHRHMCASLS